MKIECSHCLKVHEIPDGLTRNRSGWVDLQCRACKAEFRFHFAGDADRSPEDDDRTRAGAELKSQILEGVKDLAPMPQVAQKARKILADEESSFKDLAAVIETDQAIAARVLKIANSPYYGAGSKITSLQQGAVFLGMKTLQELLTLACASSVLGTELKGYGLESGALWQHALAVASCAQSIAKRKAPELKDDAFSAGLIHDCGKLVLDPHVAQRKALFDRFFETEQGTFLEAERHILGFDHTEIGFDVCEKWNIPSQLSAPVRHHHHPSEAPDDILSNIVHAADAVAMMSGLGVGDDGLRYRIDENVMTQLGLDEVSVSELMIESVEYVEKTIKGF